MKPRKRLPNELFVRSLMMQTTIMSPSEYRTLLKAARAKNKMPEFYQWQRDRKIILKGVDNEPTT